MNITINEYFVIHINKYKQLTKLFKKNDILNC